MNQRLLRKRLIRVAYENPDARGALLPLLHEAREDEATAQVANLIRGLKLSARQPSRMRMLGLSEGAVELLRIIHDQGRKDPALKYFAQRTLRDAKLAINGLLGIDDSSTAI